MNHFTFTTVVQHNHSTTADPAAAAKARTLHETTIMVVSEQTRNVEDEDNGRVQRCKSCFDKDTHSR